MSSTRVERQPKGRVTHRATSGVIGRGTSVATTGRVPETYPVDHYKQGGAFMDYRMGYRDAATGIIYTSRDGNEVAISSDAMPPLVRRK